MSYNNFTTLQIYGSNVYKVSYTSTVSSLVTDIQFDLSVATLIAETLIDYSSSYTPTEISFNNSSSYRYIIFYWPEVNGGVTGQTSVRSIRLYKNTTGNTNKYITLKNSNYTNYLAVDLGQIHNLDFLRNYGSKDNLLNLIEPEYLDYSDTNTDDILKVVWEENVPVLLLNFDDYTNSINTDMVINAIGSVDLYVNNSPVTPNGHIGFGISDGNPGRLEIATSSDFNLSDSDFTIDFWCKRNRSGVEEGVLGKIATSVSASFSFVFSELDYLVVTLYTESNTKNLFSISPITDTEWHHIAVTRKDSIISLYVNGLIQQYKNIGSNKINESVEKLMLGKVTYLL